MNLQINKMFPEFKEGKQSIPTAGRTIYSSVQQWVRPLAEAFGLLSQHVSDKYSASRLWERYCNTFYPIIPVDAIEQFSTGIQLKLCFSAILCEWMLYRIAHPKTKFITFKEAEEWFVGANDGREGLLEKDISGQLRPTGELDNLSFGTDFLDLFPYILEWFDNFTLSGEIPNKELIRKNKRKQGAVYTPSDVVEYVVDNTIKFHNTRVTQPLASSDFKILDPACGTGVFLRSAIDTINAICENDKRKKTLDVVKFLYGMDINPQAIQSCAFVLVAHCMDQIVEENLSPWRIWQAIRGNLTVTDSTLVFRDNRENFSMESSVKQRSEIRSQLISASESIYPIVQITNTQVKCKNEESHVSISQKGLSNLVNIFPECSDGFSVIIGNPPYSRLPNDAYSGLRAAYFQTAPSSAKHKNFNYYPLFVEMMLQLTKSERASAGLITPLSISYASSQPMKKLRTLIQDMPGTWRFAFFDRTPDSLFGDDVKTRNTVIIWKHDTNEKGTRIFTSSLKRWNSRERSNLFNKIEFAELNEIPLRDLIPKISNHLELDIYVRIKKIGVKLSSLIRLPDEQDTNLSEYVYYSSVAYNWIPVFRILPTIILNEEVYDRPSVRTLVCQNEKDAWFVFACLASRLTYWLWRVEGDGFHVTKEFVNKLPFHSSRLDNNDFERLILAAESMWNAMLQNPVVSTNKGKKTTTYYPLDRHDELNLIDSLLLKSLDLSENYVSFLNKYVTNNIIAGRGGEIKINPSLRRLAG